MCEIAELASIRFRLVWAIAAMLPIAIDNTSILFPILLMTTFAELDEMVPAYDELYRLDNQLTQDWYPQRVIEHAQGGSLLELGVGHGTATANFARHFSRYQVVEGSAEMIKRFRNRFDLPHVDVQHAFFEDFDTEERFDHISIGFVLEHLEDADVVLRRFRAS